MLATYMRRMHNKLEVRIVGSSCHPQKYYGKDIETNLLEGHYGKM